MSENETELNNTKKETPSAKTRASFWANVGILFSAFATIVLLVAILSTSYGLVAVNNSFARTVSYLVNGITQSQASVAETQKNRIAA